MVTCPSVMEVLKKGVRVWGMLDENLGGQPEIPNRLRVAATTCLSLHLFRIGLCMHESF
jgi:hypothetical protein